MIKQSGLSIVDKNGLPFESREQRLIASENKRLLTSCWSDLSNYDISDDLRLEFFNSFKIQMGIV